jgi:hypothetical protein
MTSEPASLAIVEERSGSAVRRSATVMLSLVTPRVVAPPLSPLKSTQGGE